MSYTKLGINFNLIFAPLLGFLSSKTKQQVNKTHDYTKCVSGTDYVFESVDNLTKGYITSQRQGVKHGDYIILQNAINCDRYQVEEIDYYSDPPDMWIALVKKVMLD
jgi:hypothetical protein